MLIDFAFACLPTCFPEPHLGGGYGNNRSKLQHTIFAFGDLDLRSGPVKLVSLPQRGRKRESAPGLNCEETVVAMGCAHTSSIDLNR